MTEERKYIGGVIKKIRIFYGLSMRKLGEKVDLHKNVIRAIERNGAGITVERIEKILSVFNKDPKIELPELYSLQPIKKPVDVMNERKKSAIKKPIRQYFSRLTEKDKKTVEQKPTTRIERIYISKHTVLVHFLLKVLPEPDYMLAEDIVSKAFYKLCNSIHTMSEFKDSEIYNFLYVTCRRLAFDEIKTQNRRNRIQENILLESEFYEKADARIMYADLLKRIVDEIESLPVARKTIFKMRVFEDCPPAEIAAKLGISTNTIGVQLARCRDHLKSVFGINPYAI